MAYSYYYGNNQQQEHSFGTENSSAPVALLAPPETFKPPEKTPKPPEVQSQQDDALDQTIKRFVGNPTKRATVHPTPSETQPRSQQPDGRKDG